MLEAVEPTGGLMFVTCGVHSSASTGAQKWTNEPTCKGKSRSDDEDCVAEQGEAGGGSAGAAVARGPRAGSARARFAGVTGGRLHCVVRERARHSGIRGGWRSGCGNYGRRPGRGERAAADDTAGPRLRPVPAVGGGAR